MADSALVGLARLVRVVDEVRLRGVAGVGVGVAAVGWWMAAWLLGQELSAMRTGVAGVAVGVITLIVAGLASQRRLRESAIPLPPPRGVVFETHAAARERRTRLAGIVVFGVIILLLFDHFTGGAGEMAGLVGGLFIPAGVVDLREARWWSRRERELGARGLYVVVPPHALMARMGPSDVFARPGDDPDDGGSPFDL